MFYFLQKGVLHEDRVFWKGGGGSNKAVKQEQERIRRMEQSIATINRVFDNWRGTGALTDVNAYDPNRTYYTADGQVYTAPTKKVYVNPDFSKGLMRSASVMDSADRNWRDGGTRKDGMGYYQTVVDTDALNRAIRSGQLYTGERMARQDLYDQQRQAVYELNKNKLDEQFADAQRNNTFSLARNGLIGGSADVDSNADLQDRYAKGLVEAQALGQNAAAELQAADESAKGNLISLAEAGLDSGSAASQAASALNSNMQTALGARGAASISDWFSDMGQLYLANKLAQASGSDPYANLYQNRFGNGSIRSGGSQGV